MHIPTPVYIDVDAIKRSYAPYHTFEAFEFGFACYSLGIYEASFTKSVDQQAFDRGLDAAARVANAAR